MSKNLVIVESPAKSKTIQQYLGKDYIVESSVGHIRDLAVVGPGGLGVDVENDFKPTYEVLPEKKKVVHQLNKALKDADKIYLATDPDREGEAISWHLKETLNIKNKDVYRVIFNEITRQAIEEAFKTPGHIDQHLVNSQETRRILDRIIGFRLSKLLQAKIKSKSAGRVQSAALKLIVDREKEIADFVIEEYYEIYATFKDLEAKLYKIDGENPAISSADEAKALLERLTKTFVVDDISVKTNTINPRPAFITSTLQQMASTKYGFTPTRTMKIAQKLYEGVDIGSETVGLITYMRTDSIRLSSSFIAETKAYIHEHFGAAYYGNYRRVTANNNVQDAHEAIRPTSVMRTPEKMKPYLNAGEYKLYQLIYIRAVASLMKAKKTETTSMLLKNQNTLFRVASTKKLFDGYLKFYQKLDKESESSELDLSAYKKGDVLTSDKIFEKQMFTTPPPRYTEARLIKEMEDLGIGRPSTYAQTIQTLKNRHYVRFEEKKFVPSDQGKLTIEKLNEFFNEFISTNYSKDMESLLDDIADGKKEQLEVLQRFYDYFSPLVTKAQKQMEKVKPQETGEHCPKCGSPMVHRIGRYGPFEACSNYPKCKYIKPDEHARKKDEAFDTGVPCPECEDATLVLRTAKKGKNRGKQFLASSNFPKCKYISPYQVLKERCPKCDNVLVKDDSGSVFCIDKNCGYKEENNK